jgi:hypothetical protein
MTDRVFRRISLKKIKPLGYISRLLDIQASGLTGHIRSLWDDLNDNSAWLGGTGEAWERGPYYLDGLLPLSILTGNEALQADAHKWVDALIASQRADGFFGPAWNLDWWPRYVVLKALVPYYCARQDERLLSFMDKYLEYMYRNIDKQPPSFWASARALEAAEAIEIVYGRTGKKYLPDLMEKLKCYMYDWFSYMDNLPYKKPMTAYTNKAIFNFFKNVGEPFDQMRKHSTKVRQPKSRENILNFNNSKLVKLISLTHGVNIAMAIKYPVTYGMMSGQKSLYKLPLKGYQQIMKYHGTANGLWTSDEHLSGPNPANGTELCTVAEMMYSLEEMLSITGEPKYADLLELLAFNTYPATFTPDMCAHQYVQQVNQIAANKKKRQFFDADSEANTYGLEPNFGCCAANMHQGFPKFVGNCCYRSPEGFAFMVYMPCEINSSLLPDKKPFRIRENTDYPFGNKIEFEIFEAAGVDATLQFRIPAMTTGELFYNGESEGINRAGIVSLKKKYNTGDKVTLIIDAPVNVVNNPDGSVSVRKGSLLLALKIEEKYHSLRGKEPFNYREFTPASDWNLAPLLNSGKPTLISVKEYPIPERPFDTASPPLEVKVKGVKVLNWKIEKNSAGAYPVKPEISEAIEITLVPYGSTNIRIAQFPAIEEVNK